MFTVSLVSDDNSREVAIGEYCKKGGDPGNTVYWIYWVILEIYWIYWKYPKLRPLS